MQKKNISIEEQREAYNKTNGRCVICGKNISADDKRWSIDHFIPRAVYKWIPDNNVRELIENSKNMFIVHSICNLYKDSVLPTESFINSIHANKKVKSELKKLYKQVEPNLRMYHDMKQRIIEKQSYKCAFCGKIIAFSSSTLRRIDKTKLRVEDNAICLCFECNKRATVAHFMDYQKKLELDNSDEV